MFGTAAGPIVRTGLLLPESVLHTGVFGILAAFVAINTVIYASLALANVLPKIHPTDWVTDRSRRAETMSIYPDSER
ncbi:hypothetical protein [Arthrobacter agilis]|uniref:hypothetical protein n=1 Tax=Arthrobacter agilis TaxID=37921 RepID=UPI002784007C|nr:hypothetical protein [Arthrobacter agilis]MDQ0736328.1 hypothetical protein [Arthrobacter agilis]